MALLRLRVPRPTDVLGAVGSGIRGAAGLAAGAMGAVGTVSTAMRAGIGAGVGAGTVTVRRVAGRTPFLGRRSADAPTIGTDPHRRHGSSASRSLAR